MCNSTKMNSYHVAFHLYDYVSVQKAFKSNKWFHTGIFLKTFYFFCSSVDLYPKISQDMLYTQPSTLEKGGGFFNKKNLTTSIWCVIQVERRVLCSSTTSSQHCDHSQVQCCCIRGGFVLCIQFPLQGVKSDSKLRTALLHHRSWRWTLLLSAPVMLSPVEHQRSTSCPGSKPQPVMTGWQCWQGSAEPTTPPGLWAQSLHR